MSRCLMRSWGLRAPAVHQRQPSIPRGSEEPTGVPARLLRPVPPPLHRRDPSGSGTHAALPPGRHPSWHAGGALSPGRNGHPRGPAAGSGKSAGHLPLPWPGVRGPRQFPACVATSVPLVAGAPVPAASDLVSIMNRSRRPGEGPSVATFPRVHRERSVGCAHDHPPGRKTQRCPVTPKSLDPPKPRVE